MVTIQDYMDVMQKGDFKGLSELFSPDGIIHDYCPKNADEHEFHVYGKEAIDMFYCNKFLCRQYKVVEPKVYADFHGRYVAYYGEHCVCVIVTIVEHGDDGKIKTLIVSPA